MSNESPDHDPIEVEVVTPCPQCNDIGEVWYTNTVTKGPETCRLCKQTYQGSKFARLAPGSLSEAKMLLAEAADEWEAHWEKSDGFHMAVFRAALAKVRKLKEQANV